jgi:ribose 5-phosphate isomerase B
MRIAVATDHAGLPLKQVTVDRLRELEHEVVDFGVDTPEPVDYPDVIAPAARAVAAGECQLGIVFGGSGSGEQMTANKIHGIRCIQATEPVTARLGREHNDANMMAIGARIVGTEVALGCVEAFVSAEYQGGRHAARVAKLDALDAKRQGSTG